MTKAQFEALRDNNLGDTAPGSPSTPLRDPVCDRTTYNAVIAEFFAAQIEDTQGTTNVATAELADTTAGYRIAFCKRGNIVFYNGYLVNVSGAILANPTFLKITNAEHLPKPDTRGFTLVPTWVNASSYPPGLKIINTEGSTRGFFVVLGALAVGASIHFSGFYYVND